METSKDETTFITDSKNNDTTLNLETESSASPSPEDDNSSLQNDTADNIQNVTPPADDKDTPHAKDKKAHSIGVSAGILLGGLTSTLVDFDSDAADDSGNAIKDKGIPSTDNVESLAILTETPQPTQTDDTPSISKTVNDDMSFDEAFAKARAELGAGATFEWRGKIYGTYTAQEWENISTAQTQLTNTDDDIEIISVDQAANMQDNMMSDGLHHESDEVEVTSVVLPTSTESSDVDIVGIVETEGADVFQNQDVTVTQSDIDNPIIPDNLDPLTTPPGDLYAFNDATNA